MTSTPSFTSSAVAEETSQPSPTLPTLRWAASVQRMQEAGVTTLIEFGPGRVLSGLARRIDRGLTTVNIGEASDLTVDAPGEAE